MYIIFFFPYIFYYLEELNVPWGIPSESTPKPLHLGI